MLTNAVASVCAGVMPVVGGAIIDSYSTNQGYQTVFIIVTGISILLLITLAIFAIWFSKYKKNQNEKKVG